MMKQYWKQNKWILAVTIVFCTGAALLAAFISILLQGVTDAAISGNMDRFMKIIIFTAGYLLFLCLINFLGSLASKLLIQRMTRQMRSDIYQGIMEREPVTFYGVNTADYISNLINDVKLIEDNYILPIILNVQVGAMFVATLALLLFLSPLVTVILIVTLAFMFLVPALLGKLLEKRQSEVSDQLSRFTEKVKDILSGFEVIRSYQLLPMMQKRFETENRKAADRKFAADKLVALNEGLSDTLSNLSMVVVIFASAYLVLKGTITVGTLMALVQLSGMFLAPVLLIMENMPKIKGVKPIIEKLNSLSETASPLTTENAERGKQNQPALPAPTFENKLAVNHLSYAYGEGKMALTDVSLTFEKGKKYALVGHSGCGKSTLIRLLTGYDRNYQGSITYDGAELKNLDTGCLGNLVSVLHQNIYLFNDSVKMNVSLDRDFEEEQWQTALQNSGLTGFLPTLPNGLDSPAGENGNLLSGGQRQRVALARAFIRNTDMIILDEGTSAIDGKTALEIETALLNKEHLTLLTITHSLSAAMLRQYDQIIYMDEGQVKAVSHFDDLIKNSLEFRDFCRLSDEHLQ